MVSLHKLEEILEEVIAETLTLSKRDHANFINAIRERLIEEDPDLADEDESDEEEIE